MQNYTKIKNPIGATRRRNIVAATILIILPLVLGAAFFAQQYRSNANVITRPEQFHAERVSGTIAQIEFVTAQQVKATILCSVSKKGVKFFCGEDEAATTEHSISTSDFNINLNTSQGYYVFSNITGDGLPIGYIPADSDNPTFGLNLNVYNNTSLGLCQGDEDFDPQLDVNQDGCVYTNDLAEMY